MISQSFRAGPSVAFFWDRLLLEIPFSLIFAAPLVGLAIILLICLFRRGSRDALGFFSEDLLFRGAFLWIWELGWEDFVVLANRSVQLRALN